MKASIAETKARLTELTRAVEMGERVTITRHGRPVAQLGPPPANLREARLDESRGRFRLMPEWDKPVDTQRLLDGGL